MSYGIESTGQLFQFTISESWQINVKEALFLFRMRLNYQKEVKIQWSK